MATTKNSYQLSILHGCIVTTKTPQEASQLLWLQQSHKLAASLFHIGFTANCAIVAYIYASISIGINRLINVIIIMTYFSEIFFLLKETRPWGTGVCDAKSILPPLCVEHRLHGIKHLTLKRISFIS